MSKNIKYNDDGLPLWKCKEYDSKIGKLIVNYNRGYKYVIWYDFDEDGYLNRKTFSKKKDFMRFLDDVKAKFVDEYYEE